MWNHRKGLWRKLTVIIFALGVFIMLTALQRQLIYFPSKAQANVLSELASRMGLQAWRDKAGEVIGWKSPGDPNARYRMLVFHGNAGYALNRNYFVTGLRALGSQWDVFLFEYPGYGAREGTTRPVFITGESLGSGVASFLASTFPNDVAALNGRM